MTKPISEERWSVSRNGDGIVSDTCFRLGEDLSDLRYYGGFLVAESIPKRYLDAIASVPDMMQFIEAVANGEPLGYDVREAAKNFVALHFEKKPRLLSA